MILAGITITQLTENGLFLKTKTAKNKSDYQSAKEIVTMAIYEAQMKCYSENIDITVNDIAKYLNGSLDVEIEKYYVKEIGLKSDSVTEPGDTYKITGIVLKAIQYPIYHFLIGNKGELLGVTIEKITDTISVEDFINVLEFEENYLGIINDTNLDNQDEQLRYFGRYILVEVYDHIGGNCANISEIEIYDDDGKKMNYSVITNEQYDSLTKGYSSYWTLGNCHSNDNLNDGEIQYTSNNQGGNNGTIFMYASEPNTNYFSRFVISMDGLKFSDIKICIGDSDNRTPKSISIYKIDNYTSETYNQNVKVRNNNGLTLLKTIEFSSIITNATWYSFMK